MNFILKYNVIPGNGPGSRRAASMIELEDFAEAKAMADRILRDVEEKEAVQTELIALYPFDIPVISKQFGIPPERHERQEESMDTGKTWEDKWRIARRLEDLLKATRQFADVSSCAYYAPDESRDEDIPAGEIVVVKFTSGYRIIVNVEMDSGTALIKDVLRGLGAIK